MGDIMTKSTPFQLSRIYASGWRAGGNCTADDPVEIEAAGERLNPHLAQDERERWSQGFKDAALNHIGPSAKARK